MKKKILIACALLIIAVVVAAFRFNMRREKETDYSSIKVERKDVKLIVATTGTVTPQNRVEIKPPISGRIEELLVDEGVAVKKGQVLGFLSSTDRAALLDAARSKGKAELERWKELYRPMPIIAPVDGNIIARSVEPGQTVTANEIMFVISDRLIIQAQIDETDIGRVKHGQPAELTLDAYPTNIITGIVDQIAYEAKAVNNVTMYMVDILLDNTPPFMRSGMTANILLVTKFANNVLTLPVAAVHTKGKDSVVWQNDPGGGKNIIHTKVRVGINDGKKIEIVSGLNEGDQALAPNTRMPKTKKIANSPFSPIRRRRK